MVTQKEIFFQWLLNERERLENDVMKLRQTIRYRNIDIMDCVELALAMERLTAFYDFSEKAMLIFELHVPADYNTITFDITPYKKAAKQFKELQKIRSKE